MGKEANPIPQGKYVPAVRFGDLVFTAGMTPRNNGVLIKEGKVLCADAIEDYRDAVRQAARNALTAAKNRLEEGEEIAKPTYGGGMGGVLPFKSDALLSLKAGADAPIGTQQHIDRLAAAALRKGAGSFKRAFEPVLKMIEKADSLEQLRELMEDDAAVAELYAAMDVSEVEELLQKVMLYADLEGRVVEDG